MSSLVSDCGRFAATRQYGFVVTPPCGCVATPACDVEEFPWLANFRDERGPGNQALHRLSSQRGRLAGGLPVADPVRGG
jgi:hypothetical protein